MFGKKKQPLAPYTLQVLTTEYLIQGTVEGNASLYFPEGESLGNRPISLSAVQIQPTRLVDVPIRMCNQYEVWGASAVALIPQADVTQLPYYDSWKIPSKPLKGVFYFGPYLVQGTMMKLRDDSFEKEVPMFDVQITNQSPHSQWGGLTAQFALMHIPWLHGYEPA